MTWSGAIFLVIPYGRQITEMVERSWGKDAFIYAGILALLASFTAALIALKRQEGAGPVRQITLFVTAAVFLALILRYRGDSPQEVVHFFMYGGLGLLLYRAFLHRVRDSSIYLLVSIAGTIVGVLDETIQWAVPGRFFDFADIRLDFSAVALSQFGLAFAFRPEITRQLPDRRSYSRILAAGSLLAAALGLCHINTPDAVSFYSERVPGLGFLSGRGDVMVEYGYRHYDPIAGSFKSRLTIDGLSARDRTGAQDVAGILDRFSERDRYGEFLDAYPAYKYPFLHEARVHIFSRDTNLGLAERATDPGDRGRRYTFALRENQILETYFRDTVRASSFHWSAEIRERVEAASIDGLTRQSLVSGHLITAYTARQAFIFLSLLTIGLAVAAWYVGRQGGGQTPARPERRAD